MMKASRYLPALVVVAGLGLGSTACAAQIYSGYPNGRYGGYSRELERRAYDNGFREGVEDGQNDARRNRDFSYQRHDDYRDADHGFHRGEGDINLYRSSFRQGFQAGYNQSFNRNARNGRDYGRVIVPAPSVIYPAPRGGYPAPRGGVYVGSPAAQNGYRDGISAGRDDARDHDRFDPVRAKRYREGDHDYNGRYGSRDEYKREYRAAFEQGYREGYGAVRR
jgi:hypothetical protein